MPGYQELIIIFLIILVLFGGKKIPEIARGLGKGMREFKKAKNDLHRASNDDAGNSDDGLQDKKNADMEGNPAKREGDEPGLDRAKGGD